jgi:hypothetical protein
MIIAVLFLAIGLLLLALLMLLRVRTSDRASGELFENGRGVTSPDSRIPHRELTDRLFGPDDWEFVLAQGSDRIKRRFLQERRAVALAWMELVRLRTGELMHRHRILARTSSQLETVVELRLTLDYFSFQIFWQLVAVVIWLHGPLGLSTLIRRVDGFSERLSAVLKQPGEFDGGADAAMSRLSK